MTVPAPSGGDDAVRPPAPDASYGLRPRPEPDLVVTALVASAVDLVWPRPAGVRQDDAANPSHRAWRFSGRWWSRPVAARRDRPWVG